MAEMVRVKDNRAYVKGNGMCINVDDAAYKARLKKIRAEQEKDNKIRKLENEVTELKEMVKQLLQGKSNNGD